LSCLFDVFAQAGKKTKTDYCNEYINRSNYGKDFQDERLKYYRDRKITNANKTYEQMRMLIKIN
jgi:hypothetical protein